jgi:hypothetical protein
MKMDKTTVRVYFAISGDNFDPEFITQKLNIEPTQSWMKNTDEKLRVYSKDEIDTSNFLRIKDPELKEVVKKINLIKSDEPKKTKPRRYSLWEIGTGIEESLDIDVQIKKVYEILKGKVEILNELRDKYALTFHLEIIPSIEDNKKPWMHFEDYIIDFLNDIKATMDIDLYIFS